MQVVDSAVHAELIDKLGGPKQVAEMTGRSTRVERQNGKLMFAVRAASESSDMDSLNIMVSAPDLLYTVLSGSGQRLELGCRRKRLS